MKNVLNVFFLIIQYYDMFRPYILTFFRELQDGLKCALCVANYDSRLPQYTQVYAIECDKDIFTNVVI